MFSRNFWCLCFTAFQSLKQCDCKFKLQDYILVCKLTYRRDENVKYRVLANYLHKKSENNSSQVTRIISLPMLPIRKWMEDGLFFKESSQAPSSFFNCSLNLTYNFGFNHFYYLLESTWNRLTVCWFPCMWKRITSAIHKTISIKLVSEFDYIISVFKVDISPWKR